MEKSFYKKLVNTIKEMKCSVIFAGVFVVVFIIDKIFDGALTQWGSISNDLLQNFEFWRLFTPTYLHSNLLHLAFNTIGILLIGYTVEKRYGVKVFLILFLASDFITNLVQSFMSGINATGAVGASCGICGLFAALVILLNKETEYLINEYKNIFGIIRALAILIYVGSSFINVFTLLGHLIGFAAGMAIMTVYLTICFYKKEQAEKNENLN